MRGLAIAKFGMHLRPQSVNRRIVRRELRSEINFCERLRIAAEAKESIRIGEARRQIVWLFV